MLGTRQGKDVCESAYVCMCFSEMTFGNTQAPWEGSSQRGLFKKSPSYNSCKAKHQSESVYTLRRHPAAHVLSLRKMLLYFLVSHLKAVCSWGSGCHTLVVVLAPHEYAAPMGEVVRNNRQSVPPGFHHGLHVMQAGVAAQVCRLKSCINLSCFLQLNDLLRRLGRKDELKHYAHLSLFCIFHKALTNIINLMSCKI